MNGCNNAPQNDSGVASLVAQKVLPIAATIHQVAKLFVPASELKVMKYFLFRTIFDFIFREYHESYRVRDRMYRYIPAAVGKVDGVSGGNAVLRSSVGACTAGVTNLF